MAIDPSAAFVSYSREDLDFVLRLTKDLKAKGAKVWMDKLDIRPGQRWELEVESALNVCSRMLVIVSPASVASKNVLTEAAYAIDEGKEVIPVVIQECRIPFRLRPFQYADFRVSYDSGLEELLKRTQLEQESEQAATQARREQDGREQSLEQPGDDLLYLDSAEGFSRLEESDRRSFVTLGMYFLSQETQTFCGVASSTMVLNALVPKDKRPPWFTTWRAINTLHHG